MSLALDELNENDQLFEFEGLTYVIDRDVLAQTQPITVDFKTFGFHITQRAHR